MKQCFTCKINKPNHAFSSNKRKTDGLDYMCKLCASKYHTDAYHTKYRFKKQDYYQDNKDDISVKRKVTARKTEVKYRKLRHNADHRGFDFNISFEEYKILSNQLCYYCDGSLPVAGGGLDRINSDLGYLIGNVVPCCKTCNIMKSTMTTEQFLQKILAVYVKHLK